MRTAVLKLLFAAPFALALSACATAPGIIAQGETAHISAVKVSLAPNMSSERFAELLRARTTQYASRFGRAGAAKELRIVVQQHRYKNPALSLLVGDANYAGGRVAVVDVASGKQQGEAEAGAVDTLAINGVIGAAIAASQDKQKVDERLADEFAKAALRHAYGTTRAAAILDRAEPAAAEPAKPDAAPAPAPKAPAKQVPVASAAKQRSAMAQATPVAAR